MPENAPRLSIIAPAFNEEACLPRLLQELRGALDGTGWTYEIILVDDASTDRTAAVIRKLQNDHPEVRGVFHKTNCGQSAALASGFREARGEFIATLDADLQNPPEEIPRLLGLLAGDVDAVCGVRARRSDTMVRRVSSKVANGYRDWITGVPVRDAGCNLRVMRSEVLREVPVFNGMHRFITTILKLQGARVLEVDIEHKPRLAGQSKYGIGNRLWRGIEDCFSMRWYRKRCLPLRRT
jgi:dolichol-phosphate mannosyltransferase